ncbi:MAG: methyltransferase domain-containing protein [Burkholderiales bacterium]|nr:methyltransferase domain-containing protein [Burkholderiales bacterium]
MPDTPAADVRRVRRRFDRCARGYDDASALAREVAARMLQRLDLVRMQPARVLDLGSGPGAVARALLERYPTAQAVALDFSLAMLHAGHAPRPFWAAWRRAEPRSVCADMARLPLGGGTFDMVCSNLALEWSDEPGQVMREVHRVLRRGGLFMFTTLGPDSLRELRSVAPDAGSHALADMHDIGDALIRHGFADPVMDMERITLTYPDVRALLAELRAGGCTAASRPAAGLRGRAWLGALERRYRAFERDGRVPASFEIVYGHAWKPEQPRTIEDGRAVIRVLPRNR